MAEPKYPDVTVQLPGDGDVVVIRSRVHEALLQSASRDEADEYLVESNMYLSYPAELLEHTRQWVNLTGSIDHEAAAEIARTHAIPSHLSALTEPMDGAPRWQFAIVNIGMFNSPARMATVLGAAGGSGWDLVAIYDKSSNWFQGFEKGFMLLKRPVPDGVTPEQWCLDLRN